MFKPPLLINNYLTPCKYKQKPYLLYLPGTAHSAYPQPHIYYHPQIPLLHDTFQDCPLSHVIHTFMILTHPQPFTFVTLTLWTRAAVLPAAIQTSTFPNSQIFLQGAQGGDAKSPRSSGFKGLNWICQSFAQCVKTIWLFKIWSPPSLLSTWHQSFMSSAN